MKIEINGEIIESDADSADEAVSSNMEEIINIAAPGTTSGGCLMFPADSASVVQLRVRNDDGEVQDFTAIFMNPALAEMLFGGKE